MKKISPALFALLLAACGDDVTEVTNINYTGIDVVESVKDLPECVGDNEGEQAMVKAESSVRVCIDGEWKQASGKGAATGDFSCKTENLKDKSSVKVVCNGDSVGVIKNGAQGEEGDAGADCSIVGQDNSTVTITCGGKSLTMNLGEGGFSVDSPEADSEKVAVSLDSLVGYTQKGPFLKGSTVYLYELSDGRTLKQTNGNFTSNIARDDGRYKFSARDLVSQYAMVVVEGYYRNEVTGGTSDAPIRLKAITDMRKRSSVNVNLLTHLELERVYYLVTREKKTVKAAKRQAQGEILKIFDIELDGNTDAEDMDVFGADDADAVLLAVSILLQGSRTESELTTLLTEISNEIEEKGEWKGDRADSVMTEMADWAFAQDLPRIRGNVESWGLNKNAEIGNFEQFVENFIADKLFGVNACGEEVGKDFVVNNKQSAFYGKTFRCHDGKFLAESENVYFNKDVEYGELVDWRTRQVYRTVKIGNREWMAENLNFDYKVDITGSQKYESYGSYCYSDSCKTFGRYYRWPAAVDSAGVYSENTLNCGLLHSCVMTEPVRGICPEGWHLPSNDEWNDLIMALDGAIGAMQASGVVESCSEEDVELSICWMGADNGSGFTVLPAGAYSPLSEDVWGIDHRAYFWSSTYYDEKSAYYLGFKGAEAQIVYEDWDLDMGASIRCVKDSE